MPNLDQYQAFVAAVEQGSFSAAARQLGKAQSAVSTSIINLEIDIGFDLFDRSSRNPSLTDSGYSMLKYARSILRSEAEFSARARSIGQGVEIRLGIAVEQGIFVHSLLSLFNDLAEAFPSLEVEIFDPGSRDVAQLIIDGQADVGIMTEQESYPLGFHFRGIGHTEQIPVCSKCHSLAKFEQVSHAELREHRQLTSHTWTYDNGSQGRQLKSPNFWVSESPYQLIEMVSFGLGWAELPWTVVSEKLLSGELHRLTYKFQQSKILHGVDVIWTKQRPLGTSGQWLMNRLLELDPGLWCESELSS